MTDSVMTMSVVSSNREGEVTMFTVCILVAMALYQQLNLNSPSNTSGLCNKQNWNETILSKVFVIDEFSYEEFIFKV